MNLSIFSSLSDCISDKLPDSKPVKASLSLMRREVFSLAFNILKYVYGNDILIQTLSEEKISQLEKFHMEMVLYFECALDSSFHAALCDNLPQLETFADFTKFYSKRPGLDISSKLTCLSNSKEWNHKLKSLPDVDLDRSAIMQLFPEFFGERDKRPKLSYGPADVLISIALFILTQDPDFEICLANRVISSSLGKLCKLDQIKVMLKSTFLIDIRSDRAHWKRSQMSKMIVTSFGIEVPEFEYMSEKIAYLKKGRKSIIPEELYPLWLINLAVLVADDPKICLKELFDLIISNDRLYGIFLFSLPFLIFQTREKRNRAQMSEDFFAKIFQDSWPHNTKIAPYITGANLKILGDRREVELVYSDPIGCEFATSKHLKGNSLTLNQLYAISWIPNIIQADSVSWIEEILKECCNNKSRVFRRSVFRLLGRSCQSAFGEKISLVRWLLSLSIEIFSQTKIDTDFQLAFLGNFETYCRDIDDSELITSIILHLLEFIDSKNSIICSAILKTILKIQKNNSYCSLQSLEPAICEYITERMVLKPFIGSLLSHFLYHTSFETLLRRNLKTILPFLVMKGDVARLSQISSNMNEALPQLILNHSHDILGTIFLEEAGEKFETSVRFMLQILSGVDETDADSEQYTLAQVVMTCLQNLIHRLCFELGDRIVKKRKTALRAMNAVKETIYSASSKSAPELSDFLAEYLLGYLHNATNFIISDNNSENFKKKVLRSLIELMPILRNKIDQVSVQLLKLFEVTSKTPCLRTYLFQLWDCFIRSLSIDTLNEMHAVFLSELLDLYDPSEEAEYVGLAVEYIMKNCNTCSLMNRIMLDFAPSGLHFINEYTKQNLGSLECVLGEIARHVDSKNRSLTRFTLKYLRKILKTEELWELNERLDFRQKLRKIAQNVIIAIERFKFSVEEDNKAYEVCSLALVCLGELGDFRLDLGTFDETPNNVLLVDEFSSVVQTLNFVVQIIDSLLYPSFKVANDTKMQERYAYVMQDLLQNCGFRSVILAKDTVNNSKAGSYISKKWDSLSESVRRGIRPFLTSKYSANVLALAAPNFPIYESKVKYREWITSISSLLIANIDDVVGKKLFNPFRILLRGDNGDVSIALFVFPYLVLSALIKSSDEFLAQLTNEFKLVLSMGLNLEKAKISDISFDMITSEDIKCVESIFFTLDRIYDWINGVCIRNTDNSSLKPRKSEWEKQNSKLKAVKGFLRGIPDLLLARAAYACGFYSRACKNFEYATRNENIRTEEIADEYQLVCSKMQDRDAMFGLSRIIRESGLSYSLDREILEHRTLGNWPAAQICYETGISLQPTRTEYHSGLIECLGNGGHYDIILSMMKRKDELSFIDYYKFGSEATWKLGRWDVLDSFRHPISKFWDFNYHIAAIIQSISAKSPNEILDCIKRADRRHVINSMDSILDLKFAGKRAIVRSLLLDNSKELVDQSEKLQLNENAFDNHVSMLRRTLSRMESDFEFKEPLLSLNRAIIQRYSSYIDVGDTVAELWITSAKEARKSGRFQMAYRSLLQCKALSNSSELEKYKVIEEAKYLKSTGNNSEAIIILERMLSGLSHLDPVEFARPDKKAAELLARYIIEGKPDQEKTIQKVVDTMLNVNGTSEKSWFTAAKFGDKLLENSKERLSLAIEKPKEPKVKNSSNDIIDCMESVSHNIVFTFRSYSRAAFFGNRFIFHVLTRCLTLWLDYTESMQFGELGEKVQRQRAHTVSALNNIALSLQKRCPVQYLLMVLPQMISRISHSDPDVWAILSKMINRVLVEYPQQSIWQMIFVSKSSRKERSQRCQEVLNNPELPAKILELVEQAVTLVGNMIILCNLKVPQRTSRFFLNTELPKLKSMEHLNLILPIQASMVPRTPSKSNFSHYVPFEDNLPTIEGFIDDVTVMNSLQKPRKVGIMGSDGRLYHFLCKPKDDLRKDSRLLEFFSVVNQLFDKDPPSRKRDLRIKTYCVTPLNEECGIIEWVPNTSTIRSILNKKYRGRKLPPIQNLLEDWKSLRQSPLKQKDFFIQKLLEPHRPPVFQSWLLENFVNPESWINARNRWTRANGVMSIVGFIVGLGDRHTENILFDESNGDAMHVDFNCLFDKGLTFEFPERVPFRLTHNMVDGFGISRTFGKFMCIIWNNFII